LLQRQLEEGRLIDAPRQKVAVFLDEWLGTIEATVRPRTYLTYELYARRHLIPELGHFQLDRLGPAHVQAMLARKLAEGLQPQTVAHLRAILRTALNRAVRFGLVSRNVASLTDPPRVERVEIKPLDPDQARRLLAALEGDSNRALFLLSLFTGVRRGEALGLQWADVDLDGAEVRVNRALQRYRGELHLDPPKTARSRRSVTIPDVVIEALRQRRVAQLQDRLLAGGGWRESDLVFTTRRGTPIEPRNAVRSFKLALRRAGLPQAIRLYDLRHSCATLLLIQGVSPRVVMEILGHSQIALTMNTYSHVIPALQREAASKLEALLKPVPQADQG
jgi:integrase